MGRVGMNSGHPGERHPNAKVTADTVRAVRAAYTECKRSKEVARRFGLRQAHVKKIVERQIWRSVA